MSFLRGGIFLKNKDMRNMNISIFVKDNNDFVRFADDLRLMDFLRDKDKIEISNSPSEFTSEIKFH